MVQNDISLLLSNTLHYFLQSYPYVSEFIYLCIRNIEKTYSNIQHLAFNNDSPNTGNNKIQPQATIVFMIMEQIFNKEQQEKAQFILNHPLARLSDLRSNEIKDLAVVWCYYSGKIEGNTYTYVETEALLKDDITSEKKYEDAKMLKNLYNTFISELEYINKGKNQEVIDERTLFRVHQAISTGLVSDEESGYLRTRGVRISGTAYIPPKNLHDIRAKLNEILYQQGAIYQSTGTGRLSSLQHSQAATFH